MCFFFRLLLYLLKNDLILNAQGAVQVLAKSFIQNKNAITKMYKCKATLQAVSHQLSVS